MTDASVMVAQIGARMHYAVPEIMARNGLLHSFHTDIVSPVRRTGTVPPLLRNSPLVRRYIGRTISDDLRKRTIQHRLAGIWYGYRLKRARTLQARLAIFESIARTFGRQVARSDMTGASAVYAYTSAGREILERTRPLGMHGFLEQYIASQPMRDALLAEERARFADWETWSGGLVEDPAHRDRLFAEWDLADTIVCPSDYVAQSLRDEGVDPARLAVVPYGVPLPPAAPGAGPGATGHRRRLRILFVGTVELRKGVHYLRDALATLPRDAYEARIVGSVRLSDAGRARLSEVAEVVGRVPRPDMAGQFAWADVFVLPSLCEGSATVTYEALSHGVPVICTPNTGSIVRDGETGFIVEAFSAEAIAEVLHRLVDDADLVQRLRRQARALRAQASVERYEADLVGLIRARTGAPRA